MPKGYLKNLIKEYSVADILLYSTMFSVIVLFIDYLNVPSKYLPLNNPRFIILFIMFSLFILFSLIFKLKLLSALKLQIINSFDKFLITFLTSSIMCLIAYMIGFPSVSYVKLYFLFCFIASIVAILFVRKHIFNKHGDGSPKSENLLSLIDVYNNKIEIHNNERFYIEEKDIAADLLERKDVINDVYNAITSNHQSKFVVSIEGEWGSGKTTIINNVKEIIESNNEDIIIIDEFDPWGYLDQEALFEGMLHALLKETGNSFSPLIINRYINQFKKAIFGSVHLGWMVNAFEKDKNIYQLKKMINNYIRKTNKKVVFILDNIDRAESKQIVFIFNLVGHVFDFDGITYLLSFDRKQVEKTFLSKGFQSGYLNKIIQTQIQIPMMDKNHLEIIYDRLFKNILKFYEVEDLEHKRLTYELIESNIDIRDFLRFLNSVFIPIVVEGTQLNLKEKLSIDFIKFSNEKLYNEIYNNRRFFICNSNTKLFNKSRDNEKYNREGKVLFDRLFERRENNYYKEILKELFPTMLNYLENKDLKPSKPEDNLNTAQKNKSICSNKYFDLYFTSTSNAYVEIATEAETLITIFSNENELKEFRKYVQKIPEYTPQEQLELIQQLHLRIDHVPPVNADKVIRALFKELNNISNHSTFLSLDAKTRTEIIISELISKLLDNDFRSLVLEWSKEYGQLLSIHSIVKGLETRPQVNGDRENQLSSTLNKMIYNVIENEINLYDQKYYYPKNTHVLYLELKEDNKMGLLKPYMTQIINENTIYKLLFDLTVFSTGTFKSYEIEQEALKAFTTEEEIDTLIKQVPPEKEHEKFLVKVYETYKEHGKDKGLGEGAVRVSKELDVKSQLLKSL